MTVLRIDLETYSSVDLKKCGVHKYAESDDFEILLFAFAFDDEPVQVVDLAQGEPLPQRVLDALSDPGVVKTAYNAAFEIACLSKHFGLTPNRQMFNPAQWRCTSVHALYLGLPGNLADVGRVVGLAPDQQKMSVGWSLIRYFCLPCKPTKRNGGRTRNLPHHDPEKWALFKAYCAGDVVAEREIARRIAKFPVPDIEWRLWALDQRMNTTGIKVHEQLVDRAINFDASIKQRLLSEAVKLTGLDNPNSREQLLAWLQEETEDESIVDLTKKTVPKVLAATDSEVVKRVLQIRQELAKTSVSKYQAMQRAACKDGRVRGLVQFYGANRTGRWAGRIVQVQNLPQNKLRDIDLARNLVIDGDLETLEMLFGNVPDTLSQLIRTAFVAEDGHRFIDVDFSAIEARVIAWLANCQWRLEVFKTHGKIYEASAEQMFKLAPGSVTKKSPYRQKGKVAELACVSEGELVLTDHGLVPIEQVTTAMRVWDGCSFIPHDGVVYRGIKEVISYEGLTATEDHVVWTDQGQLQLGDAARRRARLVQSGAGRVPLRVGRDHQPGAPVHQGLVLLVCANALHRLWGGALARLRKLNFGQVAGLPGLLAAAAGPKVVDQARDRDAQQMYEPQGRWVQAVRWQGYRFWVRVCARRRDLDSGEPGPEARARIGQDRQQRTIRAGQSTVREQVGPDAQPKTVQAADRGRRMGTHAKPTRLSRVVQILAPWLSQGSRNRARVQGSARQTQELEGDQSPPRTARVFDLINCGPNHRFTVSGRLVHNCGYQGGVGALKNMGALDMGIPEEELQSIISDWREANPEIVDLWYAVERAAKEAVRGKTSVALPVAAGAAELVFTYESGFLFITLPSGRRLAYVKPQLQAEDLYREKADGSRFLVAAAGSLTYEGQDQKTKQWTRLATYGGKLVENITQAVARDCLREAMLAIDAAGYTQLTTVHDEIVIEARDGHGTLAEVEEIMGRPINWAPGLPLRGDGFETKYFMKEIE